MKKTIFVLLFFLLFGCSVARVPLIEKKYDDTVDISQLHTFAWKNAGNNGTIDPRYDRTLRTSVEDILAGKGYRQTNEAPDMWVDAVLGLETKSVNIDGTYLKSNISTSKTQPITVHIDEGDISIVFSEAASGKVIFRGLAKSEIDHSLSPAKREQRIENTVHQMLEDFPSRK